ncbi:MAG: hypothetical protein L0Z62_31770 [Gemmataceae bacterium]|nr:hypothetical protein [Gemmataceae bacterium]
MTVTPEQYPYTAGDPALGAASLRPYLPLTLTLDGQSLEVSGLLDTAAAVNVLPHQFGIRLGAVWEKQTTSLKLTGNLAAYEARALLVTAVVGKFAPVRLAFAWAQTDEVPLLLGQINFFLEFDVCFYRSRALFEIRPKEPQN